jgi:pSer/pThr/pTyr-binding forkhead associated (FHA) protein
MEHPINGELVPQGGGDAIPLQRSPLILGRREMCDICLQFPNISGKHCELTFKDGMWILRDLDSTNGVKVNGELVTKKILHNGDVITIAKRSYVIQYQETGRASALAEFDEELEETMNMSLLEKAGLAHERRHAAAPPEQA